MCLRFTEISARSAVVTHVQSSRGGPSLTALLLVLNCLNIRPARTSWSHGPAGLQVTKAPRVGASFSTSRSEPGMPGRGLVLAASLHRRADLRVLPWQAFSG